jgi:hypothetical protein
MGDMWKLALLVIATPLFAACDAERQLLTQRFGAHVTLEATKPCAVRADFNGDGTQDVAMLVRIASEPSALPATIARANPFARAGTFTGKKRGLAIAISFEGATPKLFLLSDGEFFSSPMWQSPNELLSKIAKPKKDYLGVATESGADLRMYWTGGAWKVEAPTEAP